VKSKLFDELIESANDALAHARGKRELRTTKLPGPPKLMLAEDIRAFREQLNASQSVFAHYLNVSTKLVQAWEANRRRPEGAALRLLELGEQKPEIVFPGLVVARAPRSARKESKRTPKKARKTV
jgi:putative transcriptional regulator